MVELTIPQQVEAMEELLDERAGDLKGAVT
jgi:hypothetical protein